MDQVIKNLKSKEIIYRKSIETLKTYIANKYPEASEAYRAQVFADAVHKIIDDHIREFNRKDQRAIKTKLLRTTATKENFEIFAYDIMKTCVSLEIEEEDFMEEMTSWINRQQDIPVYRHQMDGITKSVKREIDEENRAEAAKVNKASAQIQTNLLKQLEAAFDYQPQFDHEDDRPEVVSQGVINEAYEEMLSHETRLEQETEVEEPLIVRRQAPSGIKEPSGKFNLFNVMDELYATEDEEELEEALLEEELPILTESLDESEPISTDPEKAEEERPIVIVEREPEPYFTTSEEVEQPELKALGLMEEIRAALEGSDLKKLALYSLIAIASFVAVIWLILWVVNGGLRSESGEAAIQPTTSVDITQVQQETDAEPLDLDDANASVLTNDENAHLHERIKYRPIDEEALRLWLQENDRMIGDADHFQTIIEVAQAYGVNPLLLFAITGQEQDFVPVDHEFADLIINNPFNVYGSWENYNTDLKESAQIAARTILTASVGRPEDMDPVMWINETYAEDPNWSSGVNQLLEKLETIAGK